MILSWYLLDVSLSFTFLGFFFLLEALNTACGQFYVFLLTDFILWPSSTFFFHLRKLYFYPCLIIHAILIFIMPIAELESKPKTLEAMLFCLLWPMLQTMKLRTGTWNYNFRAKRQLSKLRFAPHVFTFFFLSPISPNLSSLVKSNARRGLALFLDILLVPLHIGS